MTESPTAVTCPPETRACSRGHTVSGGADLAGLLRAADGDGLGEADGVDWEELLTRSPLATCRSSPPGASGAGVRTTP